MQQAQGAPDTDHAVIFGHGGESARVLGAIDWSANPLGPVAGWPTALKVAVQMMLASHFPKAIVWGPSLVTLHNDGFRQILGDKPVSQGRPFDEIWSEVWPEIGPLIRRAFDGHAVFIEDLALNIDRHGYLEPANFTFCYSPIRDETGRVGGVIDTVIETTGKVMAERALELRNAELAHRIKNTFAIVSVIARQSLRNAADTEAAWVTMSNRLGALSETHGLLSAGAWQDIEMRAVIEAALKPHRTGEGRFRIEGAPITLREKQALTLSLVVNELATNAAKHGALSADGGRIDIGWQREAGPGGNQVRFSWVESGGPPVVAPARESFGSRLLKLIAPQDFDGAASLDFAPGGLVYRLTGALR